MGKEELLDSLGTPYIGAFFNSDPPTIPRKSQFHYTTWAGFQSIMVGKELWAFDVRGMTDLNEIEHGLRLSEKQLRSRTDRISAFLVSDIRRAHTDQIFAACFSREGDDAAQWDRYAARGTGYAIEFDAAVLYKSIDPGLRAHATEVRYTSHDIDLRAAVARLDTFLTNITKDLDALSDAEVRTVAENVHSWMGLDLLRSCAGVKSPAYRSEAEWRILLSGESKIASLPAGPRQVVPAGTWTPEDCPIRGVIVGPRNPPETLRSLQRWLGDLGYNAGTEESFDAVTADVEEEMRSRIDRSCDEAIVVKRSDLRWR